MNVHADRTSASVRRVQTGGAKNVIDQGGPDVEQHGTGHAECLKLAANGLEDL